MPFHLKTILFNCNPIPVNKITDNQVNGVVPDEADNRNGDAVGKNRVIIAFTKAIATNNSMNSKKSIPLYAYL